MTIADNEAALWETYQDAGWTVAATWKGAAHDVLFEAPGVVTANGAVSTEYAIVYPAADMATLKEGDAITVNATKFKVRETPMPTSSSSGFFKRAPLSALR